ncbi:PolC-type DNA polymerase III [Pseudoruegeria sp. HB172150]|uniref:3'-5' exonuclease n=1 Tax=Pseudoruegeria sp. HB172150 TaxID=2721164 RepID=UPI001552846D|nr:3'-5' exonuclease [Pseudoruegeria sp. HB172150]
MSHPLFDAALIELDIAVFDLETTGLFPHRDRIIQVALVMVDEGEIGASWEQLVNPGTTHLPLDPVVVGLTGITDARLQGQPGMDEVLPAFGTRVGTRVVAGHNVKVFDIPFVEAAERRHGVEVQTTYYVDTLKLMRRLHPELHRHRLADCASHYGLTFNEGDLHDALVDTELTARVMLKQFGELAERGVITFMDMIEFLS